MSPISHFLVFSFLLIALSSLDCAAAELKYRKFEGFLNLTSVAWDPMYADSNSIQFKTLSNNVAIQLVCALRNFSVATIHITGFRQGSLVADFTLVLNDKVSLSELRANFELFISSCFTGLANYQFTTRSPTTPSLPTTVPTVAPTTQYYSSAAPTSYEIQATESVTGQETSQTSPVTDRTTPSTTTEILSTAVVSSQTLTSTQSAAAMLSSTELTTPSVAVSSGTTVSSVQQVAGVSSTAHIPSITPSTSSSFTSATSEVSESGVSVIHSVTVTSRTSASPVRDTSRSEELTTSQLVTSSVLPRSTSLLSQSTSPVLESEQTEPTTTSFILPTRSSSTVPKPDSFTPDSTIPVMTSQAESSVFKTDTSRSYLPEVTSKAESSRETSTRSVSETTSSDVISVVMTSTGTLTATEVTLSSETLLPTVTEVMTSFTATSTIAPATTESVMPTTVVSSSSEFTTSTMVTTPITSTFVSFSTSSSVIPTSSEIVTSSVIVTSATTPTSTLPPARIEVKGSFSIISGKTWTPELSNTSSEEYILLKVTLSATIKQIYLDSFLKEEFVGIQDMRFSKGSVVVDYVAIFKDSPNVSAENVTTAFKSGLTGSAGDEIGNFTVSKETIVHEVVVVTTTPTPLERVERFPDWAIAVIVCGTLLLVFLVFMICVLCSRRHTRQKYRMPDDPDDIGYRRSWADDSLPISEQTYDNKMSMQDTAHVNNGKDNPAFIDTTLQRRPVETNVETNGGDQRTTTL